MSIFVWLPLLLGVTDAPTPVEQATVQGAHTTSCPDVQWQDLKRTNHSEPIRYPVLAQIQNISGDVTAQFHISSKGEVTSAHALDGPPILQRPVESFLYACRFQPPLLNNQTTEAQSKVRISFKQMWPEGSPAPKRLKGYVLHITTKATGKAPMLDKLACERQVRDWLAQTGLKPIDGIPSDPEGTLDLSLDVTTHPYGSEVLLQRAQLRVSTWADRALAPAIPRVWSISRVAGQLDPAGDPNIVGEILQSYSEDLGVPAPKRPIPRAGSCKGREESTGDPQQMSGLNSTQLKIRRQPPPPRYPPAARLAGVQGTVVVQITTDSKGIPKIALVVSGPGALVETAIAYALQWRFVPTLNGRPQAARFTLTMPFQLN
nr:TonB family protein [uncultured Holophaga sp.]